MSGILSSDVIRSSDGARDYIARAAAAIFSQTQPDGAPPTPLRSGVVAATDFAGWTVDVLVAGATTPAPAVPVLSPSLPAVGETVVVARFGGGYVVLGAAAGAQTGWLPLSSYYQNAWVNYGAPFGPGEMVREGRWVTLRGLIRSGTATTVMTLPVGFRPPAAELFDGISNSVTSDAASAGTAHTHPVTDVSTRVQIGSDGVVTRSGNTANVYQSLSGIRFAVD